MIKRIGITGANGFIGKAFLNELINKNYNIVAYVRTFPENPIEGIDYILFDLVKKYPLNLFKDIDVLIHLAFDFKHSKVDSEDVNYNMAKFIQQCEIPYIVYMSSFAAAEPITESYYGLTKSRIESLFLEHLILRPSLVLGDGGLFKRIQNQIKRIPIVPIFNQGNQTVQTIYIDDLVNSTLILIEKNTRGLYHISHSDAITYKNFMKHLAKSVHKSLFFIPISIPLLTLLIKILSWISFLGINKDNLAGILNSKHVNTEREQDEIGLQWLNLEESLKKLN